MIYNLKDKLNIMGINFPYMEADMKKRKSIILLAVIGIIMAFFAVMTFIQFPTGIKNYNSILGAIQLDYDLAPQGYNVSYTLELSEDENEVKNIEEVVNTLYSRLNYLGYTNCLVKPIKSTEQGVKDYDIRIEINANEDKYGKPDTATIAKDMEAVKAYGKLKFYGGSSSDSLDEIFTDINPIKEVKSVGYNSNSGSYLVSITFTNEAYSRLENSMKSDFYFKITLGDETISPFDGTSAITSSNFSNKSITIQSGDEASAKIMVLQITSGGLDYRYEYKEGFEGNVVYYVNGQGVATKCVIAVGIFLAVIIAFFAVKYRGLGISFGLTLLLFILGEIALLVAIPGIKLNLGGIVGIIVATVILADGLMILAKRISEEYANGKTVKAAFKTGFSRTLIPCISTAVISEVFAILLFIFTNGVVKCFGITLAIGTVLALISVLLISRMFTSLIIPLVKSDSQEKFFNLKREEK